MRTPTGKLILRVFTGSAFTLLLAQLVRPELPHPLAPADFQAPQAVKQILRNSCYPCHSNETRMSWFDRIVPAYQLVAHDVESARMHLNFSELGAEPLARRNAVLFECLNHIQMGAMPLPRYTALHPGAALTPGQGAILRNYLLTVEPASPAESNSQAADSQYRNWIAAEGKPIRVHDAPNGIAFLPDYKNWKAISATDRTDTKTLRLILGNDIAIQAIAEKHINPWPDGTTFAKVAWRQKAAANGRIETGEFFQVAFMIKDTAKYASTAGWGWAQWTGTELKPFGRDPGFARDCVACHAPLRKNDYVFTMPIQSFRTQP